MGDGAVIFRVHVEVGIHQVEAHTANVYAPDVAVDDAAGVGNLENHGRAVFVGYLLDREEVEVLRLVVGNLLTVYAEALGEVAVAVEEADCGHGHAAVAGLLDVVACEHAKAARVYFKSVAEAILHGEVSH